MPLFGKKKKDKNKSDQNENENSQALESTDDEDDNENSVSSDAEAEADILNQALGGLSLEDDEFEYGDDDEDSEGGNDEETEEEEDEDVLSSDLLDIFTNEDEVDLDLQALTDGLEDVDAKSLLTQARQVLASLKGS